MKRSGLVTLTLAFAAGLGACATSQPLKIDTGTVAEIPVSRAVGLLNGHTEPAEAKRPTAGNKLWAASVARHRCTFGEKETLLHVTGDTLPNAALEFDATRFTGASISGGIAGQQDGVSVTVRVQDYKTYYGPGNAPRVCIVGFYPEGFSPPALQSEVNRLATAFTAIGIKQGE